MTDATSIPTRSTPTLAERGGGVFRAAAERVAAARNQKVGGEPDVLQARQSLFRDVLAGAVGNRTGGDVRTQLATDATQRAREAAQDFVAIAFVAPVLKQLRDSNNAAPPFAPGAAEKQFGSLMDEQVARQVVRASHFPLVDRVARDLLRKGGARPPQAELPTADLVRPELPGSLAPIGAQP